MKKKTFNYWYFPVTVWYTDDDKSHKVANSTFDATDDACTYSWFDDMWHFGIAFRTTDIDILAHEVHHLFFIILSHLQEEGWETFGTLGSEIYAYSFGDLFSKVRLSLESLTKDIHKD